MIRSLIVEMEKTGQIRVVCRTEDRRLVNTYKTRQTAYPIGVAPKTQAMQPPLRCDRFVIAVRPRRGGGTSLRRYRGVGNDDAKPSD